MMLFEAVKEAIFLEILVPNQDDSYIAVDYPFHNLGAQAILNEKRTVSVYYDEGMFQGAFTRPDHTMTFMFDLMVSADTKDEFLLNSFFSVRGIEFICNVT